MAIRKDANILSGAERTELVNALKDLKASGIYDQFVRRHANANMSAIHSAPAFLPWHRRFLWDLESELQRVSGNPNLGLPYWDWPSGGASASMWGNDLLGGNGDAGTGIVRSGPFRAGQWTVVNASGSAAGPLRRSFGQSVPTLPTQGEIDQVLGLTPYDVSPWNRASDPSFRNQLEGWRGPNLHNRGHVWMGGSMLPMTSPNDPVFFMHHCMVDKVWYEWQLRFPNQGYQPISGGPFGQNLTDPMDSTPSGPPGSRPIDMLDSAALGIEYDRLMQGTPAPDGEEAGTLLSLGAAAAPADIGTPGEVDLFRFEAPAFGIYTVLTTGSSDTLMTLFGPNSPNDEVASDDDSGQNFNAQITRTLSAGTYYVRVRLYNPARTGRYAIQVRPAGQVNIPEVSVDGPVINAAISAARESDLYTFRASSQSAYTVETRGQTDTFLTLYGPDSQSAEIARDDDSGFNLNSRIRMPLAPGEYFVRVRHYSPFGTGPYTIRVRRG